MNEKKLRFAAGITYYHPDNTCIQRIEHYLNIFDMVFIYDNTEERQSYVDALQNKDRVYYLANGKNNGLSQAYNKIIELCTDKFDYLCMLDQDSNFEINEIKRIIQFILQKDSEKIGIIAPYIKYTYKEEKITHNNLYNEVSWVIASGSFVRLDTIKKMRISFDEAYFIDRFDVDFCHQILNRKKKIIVYNQAVLKQELGEKGRYHQTQHSPLRHYYIFRNRLYFNHKFYPLYLRLIFDLLQSLCHISHIIAYENYPLKKLKYCFEGMLDYFYGKMGRKK